MDNIREEIGNRINSALAISSKKQKELAERLGVKDNVISYFAAGTRTPNTEQIIKIAQFCNVSSDYLLGLSEVSTIDTNVKAICDYTGLSEKAVMDLNHILMTDSFNREKRGLSIGQIDFLNLLFEKTFFDNICVSYYYLIEEKTKAENRLDEIKKLYASNDEIFECQDRIREEKELFRFRKWEMFERLQHDFSEIIGEIHDKDDGNAHD